MNDSFTYLDIILVDFNKYVISLFSISSLTETCLLDFRIVSLIIFLYYFIQTYIILN